MTPPRILVAGLGNIFHGDDGFGSEVARRLARRRQPDGVRVVDFGIRGRDLAYELLNEPGGLLLIDAAPRGGPPGSLYVLEPEAGSFGTDAISAAQAHGMGPVEIFRLVGAMGATLPRTFVVGCEPGSIDPEFEEAMGLSAAVARAVEEAVPLVESLIDEMLQADGGRHA
ncbi:hydrogenase maturation protease [Paludisphaera mucosa]|uniref:Hydrogenase maturation protease n=1 Tax=Paludisphaera mucosa TaxID=3030827 RepID=A0ABT6FDA7_9BACT|nr:hydrogenase maturation protease [Paludisphaera mucosa]MDG3005449.1 hydrogenase maturation protease [Paludisphaera mucosa]